MNKYQKEVEKQLLENEKDILNKLKENYTRALSDINIRINELINNELTQSKIYQLEYQKSLRKQIVAIIDLLSNDNIKNINDYLMKMYNDGFIGTLYNMQNENVPFLFLINQELVLKSISKKTEEFQLSKTLYQNASKLKKIIQYEITRGISQGYSYSKIAKLIAMYSETDLNKAYRIARTEGARVQNEAKYECMKRAKENGADVVKEWCAVLDNRTRVGHAKLDGQIKELDEEFEINGHTTMYPHEFGIAEEDINCRCTLLERARWGKELDDKFGFSKMVESERKEFKNIQDYNNFKEKYFDFYNKNKVN